jgi:hypothetical protein
MAFNGFQWLRLSPTLSSAENYKLNTVKVMADSTRNQQF